MSFLAVCISLLLLELSLQMLCHIYKAQHSGYTFMQSQREFTFIPYVDYMQAIQPFCIRNTSGTTNDHAAEVWFFGGSVMQGQTDDEHTIPAYYSNMAAKKQGAVKALNFGTTGYVINQERILFFELLRNKSPRKVIFFDGINEIWANTIGYSVVHNSLQNIFDLSPNNWLSDLLNTPCKTTYLLNVAVQSLFYRRTESCTLYNPFSLSTNTGDERSAQAIVDNYVFNIELIETIARHYGISAYFFWQPTLHQKAHMTSEEKKGLMRLDFDKKLISRVYALIRTDPRLKNKKNFFCLDTAFERTPKDLAVFTDVCHLNTNGNRIIARIIYEKTAH